MSRIGIDVDGVLRDFPQDLMRVVKEHYPQYINENSDKLLHWSLSDNFNCTKEDLQQIYWHDYADVIMGNGTPIYGAIKRMYDLFDWAEENGHTVCCITSQKPHARYHTLHWLGKYGLNFDTEYFRKGFEKWKVNVDYLVDDSPNNFKYWVKGRGTQEGFILVDALYNQEINSSYRVYNLDQVKNIIK